MIFTGSFLFEWNALVEGIQILNIVLMVAWGLLLILNKKLPKAAELLSLLGSLYLFFTGIYFRGSFHSEQSSRDAIFLLGYNYGLVHQLMQDTYAQTHTAIVIEILLTVVKLTLLKDIRTTRILAHVFICYYILLLRIKNEVNERNLFKKWFELNRSLIKFKEFLSKHLPASIAIFNESLNKILFKNSSFERNFETHCKLEEVLKQIKVDPEDEKFEELETVLREKECTLEDLLNQRKTSKRKTTTVACVFKEPTKTISYEAKAFSFIWDGKDAIAILLDDISYQREILSLKFANENKEKAIAFVSHELRNPVQGLLGIVELMERNSNDPHFRKSTEILKVNIHLLLNILNSMLDLQQIKAGKLKPNLAKVDLGLIFSNVKHLHEFQCIQKGLEINIELHPSVPKTLITDRNRLSQILINLTSNALKFTLQGCITIGAAPDPEDQDRIKIWVKDTGVGIRDEDKGKLFKMFAKLDDSDGINQEGVGLGLMISNSLVKVLNRSQDGINVDSKRGEGTVFYFSLPVDYQQTLNNSLESCEHSIALEQLIIKVDDPNDKSIIIKKADDYFKDNVNDTSTLSIATAAEESSLLKLRHGLKSHSEPILFKDTILIVDDDAYNLMIYKSLLQNKNFQLSFAYNGQQAIEQVTLISEKGNHIRLILIDFEMPIMTGPEATKILKQMMSEKKIPIIPIIGLSANSEECANQRWKEAGMDDYLCKPLTKKQLDLLIQKYSIRY